VFGPVTRTLVWQNVPHRKACLASKVAVVMKAHPSFKHIMALSQNGICIATMGHKGYDQLLCLRFIDNLRFLTILTCVKKTESLKKQMNSEYIYNA